MRPVSSTRVVRRGLCLVLGAFGSTGGPLVPRFAPPALRRLLGLAVSPRVVHPSGMNARTPEPGPPIPCAPFDDLDLEKPEDESEWDRRVMALASARIATERVRLERLGIIGEDVQLISRDLPQDPQPAMEPGRRVAAVLYQSRYEVMCTRA